MKFVTTSRALARNVTLAKLLEGQIECNKLLRGVDDTVVIGWGKKRSGKDASKASVRCKGHHILEDGFLRSVRRRDEALSFAFDDDGIYYDAQSHSRLFDLIWRDLTEAQSQRARDVQGLWRDWRVSKYNDSRPFEGSLNDGFVLVIDQVRNDQSIIGGMADQSSFERMLQAAMAEHPDKDVVVKVHPDSVNDPRKRHFDLESLAKTSGVHVIADKSNVVDLIEKSSAVYTVTSQVGFEALIWDKPVRTFGMPFYAGWGLTRDELSRPADRRDVALEQLVHAALIDYPRYWHPVLDREAAVEEVIALIGLNIGLRRSLPSSLHAVGFSKWKRPFIAQFADGSQVEFVKKMREVPSGANLLVWGNSKDGALGEAGSVLRAEDGFLRSSGLGADLVRPLSLVIDDLGIYYDATRPSRLEHILMNREFCEQDRARARSLREMIVGKGISKYNLGGAPWSPPAGDRDILLAVGQVETDASIKFGSPRIKTNLDLLRQVRERNPDAYIIYKPHPDVVAGLRKADSQSDQIAALSDEIVTDVDANSLFPFVKRIHTITSLLGFEALLRNVPVTCHGLPFYAGWGLTEDTERCERRGRKLTLDELVFAALIAYPRYFSCRGNVFASPEDILVELEALKAAGPQTRTLYRKALRFIYGSWARVVGR